MVRKLYGKESFKFHHNLSLMPGQRNIKDGTVQYTEEDTNSDISQWDLPGVMPLEVMGPGKKTRRILGNVPLSRTVTERRTGLSRQ